MSILLAQARLGTWVTNQPALPRTRSCNLKFSQMCWFDLLFLSRSLFYSSWNRATQPHCSSPSPMMWDECSQCGFDYLAYSPFTCLGTFCFYIFYAFIPYSKFVSLKRKFQGRNVQNHGVLRACTIRLPQSTPEFDSFIPFYSFGLEQVEIFIVGTLNPIWMELGLWSWAAIYVASDFRRRLDLIFSC